MIEKLLLAMLLKLIAIFSLEDVDLVFAIEVFRIEVLEETILSIPTLSVKIAE